MPKQKLEIEIEVPDGYRCVGFGHALPGTMFLTSEGGVDVWRNCGWGGEASNGQYFILERVELWRPATVADVIRSLQGEKVVVRFADSDRDWKTGRRLEGVSTTGMYEWFDGRFCWELCEVLDTEDSSQ